MKSLFTILLFMIALSSSVYSQDDENSGSVNQQPQAEEPPPQQEKQQEVQQEQQNDVQQEQQQNVQQEQQPNVQQEQQPNVQQEQQPNVQQEQHPNVQQEQHPQENPELMPNQNSGTEQPNGQQPDKTQEQESSDQSNINPEQQKGENFDNPENPVDHVQEGSDYEMQDVTTWKTEQIEEVIPPEELLELSTPDAEDLSEAIDDLSQKQLQILEELPVEKLAEVLKISEKEAEVLQQEISSNTNNEKQTYQFTEEISNEKVREITVLKDDAMTDAISELPVEQIEELVQLPPDKLSKILKISEPQAAVISEKIRSGIVIPYDSTPVEVPEVMSALPGGKETAGIINYVLTAGLDMTPLQRKKTQKVVIIVILCTLLPYLLKKKKT